MDPSTYEPTLSATGILSQSSSQIPTMHHHHSSQSSALSNQMLLLQNFWQSQLHAIEHGELDFKNFQLPLARIKKVMKTDEDVKMISAEAPIIFAKACEIFILELTLRSWLHTEDSKRRTLQRSDVSAAVQKTDTFDFLIDIVPREDTRSMAKKLENDYRGSLLGDPSFYLPSQLALQQQLQMQNAFAGGGVPMQPTGSPGMDQLMYYQQQAQLQQQMQMMHRHQLQQQQQQQVLPSDAMFQQDYSGSLHNIRNAPSTATTNMGSQLPSQQPHHP